MPQISLYIDKETLSKVEKAASREKMSISRWVGRKIKKAIQEDYPQGYFDLFGSISDKSFKIDSQSFKHDSPRERL
ncbi:MAG TPA: toxin-antitoxin system, antitoxin component [Spirochaetota bacterium]|nr:toxin-antitoxin system, antitoxin component [Spirochaetota bacterium]HSA15515.1 toxin-antitoxin system, antitoxin component [Spirochaetota bacterium]